MPKIPILTAQQGPGVLQLPGVPSPQKIVTGFEEIRAFGETLGTITDRMQKQQDDLDYIDGTSMLDTGWEELKLGLKENPDYRTHELQFLKGARELSEKVRKRYGATTVVGQALLAYERKHVAREAIRVRFAAQGLIGQEHLGRLEIDLERLSREAAEAKTPEEREEKKSKAMAIIDRTQQRGYFGPDGPLEAAKKKLKFQKDTLNKNLDYWRRISQNNPANRATFRQMERDGAFADADQAMVSKQLELTRQDEQDEEGRRKRIVEEASRIVKADLYGKANYGKLTQAELDEIKANHNPWVDAIEWHALNERNENPPSSEGNLQVRALHTEFGSALPTRERVARYIKRAEELGKQLGKTNKELIAFQDHLAVVDRAMRGVHAAEIAANLKVVDETLKAQQKPQMPGIIGTMQKNKEAVDAAKEHLKIIQGVPLEKVLKGIKDRNQEQFKEPRTSKVPQPLTDILDVIQDPTDYRPGRR